MHNSCHLLAQAESRLQDLQRELRSITISNASDTSHNELQSTPVPAQTPRGNGLLIAPSFVELSTASAGRGTLAVAMREEVDEVQTEISRQVSE